MSTAYQMPRRQMTVAEFLEWADATPGRWQLRDGEPEMMNAAAVPHGAILAELAGLLREHLRAHRPGCRVIVAPGVIPRARSDHNMLVPDLAVTCGPRTAERSLREPVVLIEILSPSNETATRANIWAFLTIPTVAEVVALHSVAARAEVWRRGPDGSWPERAEEVGRGGAFRLDSLGFEAPLLAVYRETTLGEG